MKKVDKLVLRSFLGLFVLTFCVAFFVLLMQFLLLYFDELIGKGLSWSIYLQLVAYIGVPSTKQAFPLSILLASIMSMGNLGEHYELTALKSAGVSLPRILRPLLVFTLVLTVLVFFSNSYLVPRANLNVLTLLHDLSKKKPSVAIKEGVFYDGIPGYSIKVRKKLEDQKTLQDIMIYDHTQQRGNVSLTMARSGKLYTIRDEEYMVLELFDGHNYMEEPPRDNAEASDSPQAPQFYRSTFKSQKLILSLEAFKLTRTRKEAFADFYRTKSGKKLAADVVAMQAEIQTARQALQVVGLGGLQQTDKPEGAQPDVEVPAADILQLKAYAAQLQRKDATAQPEALSALYQPKDWAHISKEALAQARDFADKVTVQIDEDQCTQKEITRHTLEWHKMLAWAAACIVVLLVGAPLGAIIKKGGLGIPLLIATCLIVWHYIFEMLGEKWARAELVSPLVGAWLADWLLLPFGVFFSIQAYRDARLLEADFYAVILEKIKKYAAKICRAFRRLRGR